MESAEQVGKTRLRGRERSGPRYRSRSRYEKARTPARVPATTFAPAIARRTYYSSCGGRNRGQSGARIGSPVWSFPEIR